MSRINLQRPQPKQRCGHGRKDHSTCHHPVQAISEVRNDEGIHVSLVRETEAHLVGLAIGRSRIRRG